MTRRLREGLKTALIAILLLGAAAQFGFLMYSGSEIDSLSEVSKGQSVASPMIPYCAALPSSGGYSLLTLERGLKVYCEGARALLSELFATMSDPVACESGDWESALGLFPAVFYYGADLPLEVISDGEASADISCSVMALVQNTSGSAVYFKSSEGCYRSETDIKVSSLFENVPVLGTPCALARSLASTSALSPETAVPGNDGSFATLKLSYPALQDWAGQIVSAFGGDGYSVSSFFDENGQRVCILPDGLIYLGEGSIRFSAEKNGIDCAELGIEPTGKPLLDAARAASAVASACISDRTGMLGYIVSGVEYEGERVIVNMDMLADGIYLIGEDGSRRAARFEFSEGRLLLAELTLAHGQLSLSSGGVVLTPSQNAALLLSGQGGGRLETVFVPVSDGYERRLCLLER